MSSDYFALGFGLLLLFCANALVGREEADDIPSLFICIALAAVGIWAIIDSLIAVGILP